MQKTRMVRFYAPALVDINENHADLDDEFWNRLFAACRSRSAGDREFYFATTRYYGEVLVEKNRHFLYFGRIRGRHDFPAGFTPGKGPSGVPFENDLSKLLMERTYCVPFGARNRVAIMAPVGTPVGASAIGDFCTRMLKQRIDAVSLGGRIIFKPLVDTTLDQKLDDAVGVSRLDVKVDSDTDSETLGALGHVGGAIARAQSELHDATIDLAISLGRNPDPNLLAITKKLKNADKIKSAKARLVLPDGEGGFVSEVHDLFADRVAIRTPFSVDDEQTLEHGDVIEAIDGAIVEYNQQTRAR